MSETFANMPLKNINISMLAGCLAIFMIACGYYGLYLWMSEFSHVYAVIILISIGVFLSFGSAHHVFCGVAEWFYVRMGMTEDARKAVVKFFKDTLITMIGCYIGLMAKYLTAASFCTEHKNRQPVSRLPADSLIIIRHVISVSE